MFRAHRIRGVMNFVTLLKRVFCRLHPDVEAAFIGNDHAHY